jgi:hypothetical protein
MNHRSSKNCWVVGFGPTAEYLPTVCLKKEATAYGWKKYDSYYDCLEECKKRNEKLKAIQYKPRP